MTSKRNRMRDLAEELLRQHGAPMHYSELAAAIYSHLALEATEPPKALNTALHDDPAARFRRVGKGTWELAAKPRGAS